MRAIDLADALQKPKFIPSDPRPDNGKNTKLKHPDCVLFNDPKSVAVVAHGELLHSVDLDDVSNPSLA